MKSFKQFQEESEPVYSTKQYTKFGKSKYPKNTPYIIDDFIKNRAKELFKFKTGIPLAKREYTGKIDSGVLKAHPELDPTKPGDYIKLKRLTSKVRKAHYEPEGELVERTMTSSEKRKDTMLKKKYDKSDMKKSMQKQYLPF